MFPLEAADFGNAYRGECCHEGDFSFRILRNLQNALQLIERESTCWFANHTGQSDRNRGILSRKRGAFPSHAQTSLE